MSRLSRWVWTEQTEDSARCTQCDYPLRGLLSQRCPESGAEIAPRYRTKEPLNVICWWWYDTVTILPDYSDCAEATLNRGTVFTVRERVNDDPARLLCVMDDPHDLVAQVIPAEHRTWRGWFVGRAVGFCVELSRARLEQSCERV